MRQGAAARAPPLHGATDGMPSTNLDLRGANMQGMALIIGDGNKVRMRRTAPPSDGDAPPFDGEED